MAVMGIDNQRAMRKYLILFLFFLSACLPLAPLPAGTPQPSATPSPVFSVRAHPDGTLYVGDQVSFEVFSPTKFEPAGKSIRISLADKVLDETSFAPFGVGNRNQANFYWVWDTRSLQVGNYTLTFTLLPEGERWQKAYTLRPASELPAVETKAVWKTTESVCCTIHYISNTDSEKDMEALKTMLDAQAVDVAQRMQTKLDGKIPFTFLPRTLGHGGFTSDEIYVSYLHQNYAGGATQQVSHHEMVHWFDSHWGGDMKPSMLAEGLAVYISGGHFKVEPILPRGAALIEFGWYVPLRRLADSFYLSQHEIGYAEAAALINYLVNTHGWEAFTAFYRDIHPVPSGSQADAVDAALKVHFNTSLEQLDKDFSDFLRQQSIDEATRSDLHLTVAFYDAVRRYQQQMDPSAYFLNAWLPDVPDMRKRGIVADYLRHPDSEINRQIEGMLVDGDARLRSGNYSAVETDIRGVNLLLDLLGSIGK
jgi:hypothetical protein